jgi:hypothetical protein
MRKCALAKHQWIGPSIDRNLQGNDRERRCVIWKGTVSVELQLVAEIEVVSPSTTRMHAKLKSPFVWEARLSQF